MGAELKQEDGALILLELAASDDLDGFKSAIENSGLPVDELGLWYARRIGSNKMGYELRTPLMVASLYGSTKVVDYILRSGLTDVNRVAGSDRATPIHCAVAGGSDSAAFVVNRLIAAGAEVDVRATELIPRFAPKKQLENLLVNDKVCEEIPRQQSPVPASSPERQPLPDINNAVYSTDEFRMYCFKIKPCSRAYTHDWTECPFAHPGENARRRDPSKYQYTCVPCPDFKKGSCKKGDDCEFAHGVFESWLHPAQYRTRLCKDETGCARKVCFFAHKKEELRPVYHATGSAIPGPDMGVGVGMSMGMASCGISAPPLSPSLSPKSSGVGGGAWQGKVSPPSLQLPGSRLRASLSARDVELERELIKIETQIKQQQQQQQNQNQTHHYHHHQNQILSPRPWDLNPVNLEAVYGSITMPRKLSPPRGFDSSSSSPKSVAAAMLNSRAAAFAKRSQSFVDRAANYGGGSGSALSSPMADWGSPKGRAEWGVQGEELNKLRKSNSFGFRASGRSTPVRASPPGFNEPDVSWVNSLVKEEEMRSPWVEQLYIEQQQLAA